MASTSELKTSCPYNKQESTTLQVLQEDYQETHITRAGLETNLYI